MPTFRKISLLLIAAFVLLAFLFLSCNSGDDDDNDDNVDPEDDDAVDPGDWTAAGCEYTYGSETNASQTTAASSTQSNPYDDCIPELPSDVDRSLLVGILDAYLGTWVNQDGEQRTVTCNPQGYWEVPRHDEDAACDYSWIAPVYVELAESDEQYVGKIYEDSPPLSDAFMGYLSFTVGEDFYGGDRILDANQTMTLYFAELNGGETWTKAN